MSKHGNDLVTAEQLLAKKPQTKACTGDSSLVHQIKSCALQLYEEVCDAEGCNDIGCSHARDVSAPATIMLLPPQFSVLNETRLPELVRL